MDFLGQTNTVPTPCMKGGVFCASMGEFSFSCMLKASHVFLDCSKPLNPLPSAVCDGDMGGGTDIRVTQNFPSAWQEGGMAGV